MNALIKKEMRLLLPVWDAAMLLAAFPVWFCPPGDPMPLLAALVGMAILAVTSFGREFASGTFALLLAQPVSRRRLWGVKLGVLSCALSLVCLTYVLSNLQNLADSGMLATPGVLALCVPLATAGGFCSMLLIRQTIPAFAVTALTPPAILLPGLVILDAFRAGKTFAAEMLFAVLAIYAVLGILWSWRLFSCAQEVSWTGDGAPFARLPFFREQFRTAHISGRSSPLRALLGKEFHLHATTLIGMTALFAMHLLILACRHLYLHSAGGAWEDLDAILVWSGALWLLPPFLIAAASVADERRLGTMDAQLCLPVSRRLQFTIKFLFSLIFGGFASALLLIAAEKFGALIGVRYDFIDGLASYFDPWSYSFNFSLDFNSGAFARQPADAAGLVTVFLAVSCLAFYASTLASGILEALGLGAVLSFLSLVAYSTRHRDPFAMPVGKMFWGGPLILWIGFVVFSIVIVWLSQRNFGRWHERRRMWQRNVLGLTAAALVSAGLSVAIFHRTWELLVPVEQDHHAARLSLSQPPTLVRNRERMALLFPDGKLWLTLFSWTDELAIGHFVMGSDWADVALPDLAAVAIRKDGTLWYSRLKYRIEDAAEGKIPVKMARIGGESDWRKVMAFGRFALLLKTDGTLWLWGPNDEASMSMFASSYPPEASWLRRRGIPSWPGLDAFGLYRVGTRSDWVDLFTAELPGEFYSRGFAKSAGGQKWVISSNALPEPFDPAAAEKWIAGVLAYPALSNWDFPGVDWKTVRGSWNYHAAIALRSDGTVGVIRREHRATSPATAPRGDFALLGHAADWRAVAASLYPFALKTNGTLWSFLLDPAIPNWEDGASAPFPDRWKQVDVHTDWLGIYTIPGGILLLAADGSLWRVQSDPVEITDLPCLPPFFLVPSRHPQPLGNLFTDDLAGKTR